MVKVNLAIKPFILIFFNAICKQLNTANFIVNNMI